MGTAANAENRNLPKQQKDIGNIFPLPEIHIQEYQPSFTVFSDSAPFQRKLFSTDCILPLCRPDGNRVRIISLQDAHELFTGNCFFV